MHTRKRLNLVLFAPRLVPLGAALFFLLLALGPVPLRAEDASAERSFAEAVRFFQGGWYDRAERELAEFLAGFPHSTNRSQAILLQAQSRYQLHNYDGAIALLQDQWKTAGPWTDSYLYWLAEAHAQQERYDPAARIFAQLLNDFPDSSLRLEASYEEAFAQFRLGNTAKTVELLRNPNGALQQAAKNSTNQTLLVRGVFLLAEALFAQRDFVTAEQSLKALTNLTPEAEWQREYLLTRIEMAEGRTTDASLRIPNLVSIAASKSNAVLQAKSLSLKAEILETREPDVAAQTYEAITKIPGVTPEQTRQALLKLVDLALAQNRFSNAVVQLESYLKQNPLEPAADLFRMSLGEIYLKQYYAAMGRTNNDSPPTVDLEPAVGTNLLRSAQSQFDYVITRLTNSPSVGKAYLDRGWCFWEEFQLLHDTNRLVESQRALEQAASRLPKSFDQATARFRLGDCSLRLGNPTNALANYKTLLTDYPDISEVKEKLLENALFQIVRASIEARDLPQAQSALDQLLRDFPKSSWADQALLLYARALFNAGDWARTRATLTTLEKQFPNSPSLPEGRLLGAKTFAREHAWAEAIQGYQLWLKQFTNHPARAEAAFDQAWCYSQSGSETNALHSFTNLVQQFPTSSYASLAKLWAADYYLNQPDYERAEIYYKLLFTSTNSVPAELAREAQLMAAKAAFFRQDYSQARSYLTNLVNDAKIGPEAWFMLGDVELTEPTRDSPKKLEKFEQAILRFQRVVYSTNKLVPLAMAKIGDCHFELAAQDPARYDMATNQYWLVLSHPLADALTRSQAEFALGRCLEKMAEQRTNQVELLNQALDHYLAVVYKLEKDAEPDPFWLSQSALAAGRLATDRLRRFDEAERLYQKMRIALPSLSPVWDTKLLSVRQQLSR